MKFITNGLAAMSVVAVAALAAPAALAGAHLGAYDIRSFEDLEFAPMEEGSPIEISVLWGDPATGPSGFLVRIPAGFEAPMHSHTST